MKFSVVSPPLNLLCRMAIQQTFENIYPEESKTMCDTNTGDILKSVLATHFITGNSYRADFWECLPWSAKHKARSQTRQYTNLTFVKYKKISAVSSLHNLPYKTTICQMNIQLCCIVIWYIVILYGKLCSELSCVVISQSLWLFDPPPPPPPPLPHPAAGTADAGGVGEGGGGGEWEAAVEGRHVVVTLGDGQVVK